MNRFYNSVFSQIFNVPAGGLSCALIFIILAFSSCQVEVGGNLLHEIEKDVSVTYTFFSSQPVENEEAETESGTSGTESGQSGTETDGSENAQSGTESGASGSTSGNAAASVSSAASSRGASEEPDSKTKTYVVGRTYGIEGFPAFTREGMETKGWRYYKNPNLGTTACPSNFTLDSNNYIVRFTVSPQPAYIYADWQKAVYVINFMSFLGTGSQKLEYQKIEYEDCVPNPGQLFNRDGYTFEGWYTSPDGKTLSENPYDFTLPVKSAFDLYGGWTPIVYTITYEIGDGEWVEGKEYPESYTIEDNVVLPVANYLTKTGYGFSGWYLSSDFSDDRCTEIPLGSIGNKTFYAKWTEGAVEYLIRHFIQPVSGSNDNSEYTECKTKYTKPTDSGIVETGITGTEVQVEIPEDYLPGFYVSENEPQFIKADGTTVINVYFDRKYIEYTFDANGGLFWDADESIISSGLYESEVQNFNPETDVPSREHYNFAGWKLKGSNGQDDQWVWTTDSSGNAPDGTKVDNSQFPNTYGTENLTFEAVWTPEKYEVKFEVGEGAEGISARMVEYLSNVTRPEDPEKTGYRFMGWYTSDDGGINLSENTYDFDTPVEEDFTLYAKWHREYKVTYISDAPNRGKETLYKYVLDGDCAGWPDNFSKEDGDYSVWDWYTDSSLEDEYYFNIWDNEKLKSDITLYAKWELCKIITYHSDSKESSFRYRTTDDFVLFDSTDIFGYDEDSDKFIAGWTTDPDSETIEYDAGTCLSNLSNLDIYPVYTDEYRTITFVNSADPSESFEFKLALNSKTKLASLNFYEVTCPKGYSVANYTTEDVTQITGDISIWDYLTVSEDKTYYVLFVKSLYGYNNYQGKGEDDDSGLAIIYDFYYRQEITEPENKPSRDNYDFAGWFTDKECTTAAVFSSTECNIVDFELRNDPHVYALWTPIECFNITFNGMNGTTPTVSSIAKGEKVPKPSNPEKTGYHFTGWKVSEDEGATCSGDDFDFENTVVTGEIYLCAVYEINQYEIIIDPKNGDSTRAITLEYGSSLDSLSATDAVATPSRAHYIFDNWYPSLNNDGTNLSSAPYDFSSQITQNVYLCAKWDKESYTVHFINQGGVYTEDSVLYEEKASAPSDPDYTGHTFAGWYTSSDGGTTLAATPYNFNTPVEGELYLYSGWTKIKYNVTFDPKNGESAAVQQVEYQDSAVEPADPTRTDYNFEGWYLSTDGGETLSANPYDFTAPVTEPVYLCAKWSKKTGSVTVTINMESAQSTSGITVSVGADGLTLTATPSSGLEIESYTWKMDGVVVQSASLYENADADKYTLDADSDEVEAGVHDFTVIATDKDEKKYSASGQLEVSK